ncbi:MAG: DUF1304 domain-containing protein [Bacteroidia bacterium]|nr:DUF1304 domain-containing protein [Bacteroidia bacterium]MBT8278615.1 DUF1304 domain-containing protein [Bacteroidia bacterium]NND24808.1 DUF1304 domain-containing protein [Flavobacteriaceae bacterium]NNK61204.1 DUF1304 domain-containing protein [Flavobacteriaceae bacterium]RZW56482.1 MAG: DUF1304 domain-containing protein [Flavobacteriaceae bacterium]
MELLLKILIGIVAFEHLYFMYLEMFLWTKPKGIKTFGLKSKEFAEETKVLAANQGLYNGFLAAGLIWSLVISNMNAALFFLICVTIAGIYGAYTTGKIKLFYVQSIPAILATIIIFINYIF